MVQLSKFSSSSFSLPTTPDASSYKTTNWIELNQTAFEHNLVLFKSIVGPTTQIALVIKSNAYGHGMQEIAQIAKDNPNVDWFCTTYLSEALLLRQLGITKPLLVMAHIDENPRLAIEHDINLTAYAAHTINELNAIAALEKKPISLHIKIDTGLSRLGLLPEQACDFIQWASSLSHIKINGMFSHFAEADNPDKTFSNEQVTVFKKIGDELKSKNIQIPLQHIDNTLGITTITGSHFNMVRIGAGAYGLTPSPNIVAIITQHYPHFYLNPVMTWKTIISDIRSIPAGKSIGYNRTFTASKDMKIGILPVGYYEGYDRRLSNKGTVLVITATQACYAPVVGRICMNMIMIDVSEISDVASGNEVILLGNYPKLQATDIATTIESFNPREITTRLNPTIRKIII